MGEVRQQDGFEKKAGLDAADLEGLPKTLQNFAVELRVRDPDFQERLGMQKSRKQEAGRLPSLPFCFLFSA